MFLARVTGSLVSTHKVASMTGQKLLLVEPLRVVEDDLTELKPTGRSFVVVDTVGAGTGEIVFCVQGSSARFTPETKTLPVDAAIVGIVDRVHAHGAMVFDANQAGQPGKKSSSEQETTGRAKTQRPQRSKEEGRDRE